ncbi:MAG: hypothetical protein LBL61_00235 [Elusimicrobiota bacterium]|jgi:hypothetical protein|nr:hypothetical protein [Elusimicrobiota bacterium]
MKKKKALLFTFAVLAIGFAGGVFTGRYYAGQKPPEKVEQTEEKVDLKKDLAKIRALQKEITLYTDKAADARGAVMAYDELKPPVPGSDRLARRVVSPFNYSGEQQLRRKEYYLANPDKIPFYKEEMGETKRHNAIITSRDKKEALEKELKEFVDKKMYIADKQNLELESRYWAGRVLNDKDVTFEELAVYSINWIHDGNLLKELMMTIKYYVDAGHVEPLTEEEEKIYDKNKSIIVALLHPGKSDEELLASLTEQDCIDIMAEHYAEYNVKYDWKWDNIENRLNSSYKDGEKIFAKAKEIVEHGKARWLSLEEEEAVNACNVKMRIPSPPRVYVLPRANAQPRAED